MKHKPQITNPESTELKDRTTNYFVRQIPPYNLTSYNLTPTEDKILSILWHDTFMGADSIKLTYKEYTAFTGWNKRTVSEAFGGLKEKGIISITKEPPSDKQTHTKQKKETFYERRKFIVTILKPLLKESDKVLAKEQNKIEERYQKISASKESQSEEPEEVNNEIEINSSQLEEQPTPNKWNFEF